MKYTLLSHITSRGWVWIALLYLCSVLFYMEFFSWYESLGLGFYITIVLIAMILVGYIRLGKKQKFPVVSFIIWVLIFSCIRYTYIFFFLSKHLPEYTVFHHVGRVLPTVIFTTASMIFLGYTYAIYEWGLAAREKHKGNLEEKAHFSQPIIIKSNGNIVYLLPQDIFYIEANGEYVNYHLEDKRYTVFKRLKSVDEEMRAFGFKRTHRSYIVNTEKVTSISNTEITLKNGVTVPLSKTYKASVSKKMMN